MSKYACTNTTYTLLKVPRKCSSTLILPFHSQGRFGSAIHHNSKSPFQLGCCNCINTSGRMEVRKLRPYDVFLATPWVQMWRKNITSESHSTYEIGSLHYFPVSQTDCCNNRAPPCYLPVLLHLFLLWCKHIIAGAHSLNKTTKLTTVFCQALFLLSVFVSKQGNKVLKVLRRVFMVAGCLYFCQQCREKTQLSRVEALEGWFVYACFMCVWVDGRCIQIVWRYLFTVRRQWHPGSNKVFTNPRYTNTFT